MLRKLKILLNKILFQVNKQQALSTTAYFDEIMLSGLINQYQNK